LAHIQARAFSTSSAEPFRFLFSSFSSTQRLYGAFVNLIKDRFSRM
jgi:hypothetical protein